MIYESIVHQINAAPGEQWHIWSIVSWRAQMPWTASLRITFASVLCLSSDTSGVTDLDSLFLVTSYRYGTPNSLIFYLGVVHLINRWILSPYLAAQTQTITLRDSVFCSLMVATYDYKSFWFVCRVFFLSIFALISFATKIDANIHLIYIILGILLYV